MDQAAAGPVAPVAPVAPALGAADAAGAEMLAMYACTCPPISASACLASAPQIVGCAAINWLRAITPCSSAPNATNPQIVNELWQRLRPLLQSAA